jgi:integral membrane sensor domain MASE1
MHKKVPVGAAFARLRGQLGREQTFLVLIAVAYIATGKIALMLGYAHPVATYTFPPAGIALGALLVLGYRVWPVILLASTLLYSSVLGAVAAVPILAAANTLEGLLAPT